MRIVASLSLLLLTTASAPVPAESHAVLVRSVPAARAVLSRPPGRVQVWFSERLEPAFSSMAVWSASGAQVDKRDATVSADDPKQLAVTLGALEPGPYMVRYRVLSVDGHVIESSFPFTIKSPHS
jgi:hypothetical protein